MDEYMREDLIKKVEQEQGRRSEILRDLDIPRSTYYKWRSSYDEDGLPGLAKTKPQARHIWNRLTQQEKDRVLEVARLHPELSPRLLSVKITDEEDFSVSGEGNPTHAVRGVPGHSPGRFSFRLFANLSR